MVCDCFGMLEVELMGVLIASDGNITFQSSNHLPPPFETKDLINLAKEHRIYRDFN